MWLTDFLPQDVAHIRIMTYGYDSRLFTHDTSHAGLLDYTRDFIQQLENSRTSAAKVCTSDQHLRRVRRLIGVPESAAHLSRAQLGRHLDPAGRLICPRYGCITNRSAVDIDQRFAKS